jgi:hypothetical protein
MLMLSMQMQQMAQQILIQQQIFMQQMQVHMSIMENCADTCKTYLCWIVKSMTTHNDNIIRGARLMRSRMIAQMMTSNYVIRASLNIQTTLC